MEDGMSYYMLLIFTYLLHGAEFFLRSFQVCS